MLLAATGRCGDSCWVWTSPFTTEILTFLCQPLSAVYFPFLPGRRGRMGGDGWWFVALNMLWWKTWFSRRSVRLARQEPSLICLASGVSTAQSADQAAGGSAESRALFTLQLTAHWGCVVRLDVPRFDVCLFSANCKKLHIVGTWWEPTEHGLLDGPKGAQRVPMMNMFNSWHSLTYRHGDQVRNTNGLLHGLRQGW